MVTARSELTSFGDAAALVLQRHCGHHSYQYSAVNGHSLPTRKSNGQLVAEG
jgi:hypothetical protein